MLLKSVTVLYLFLTLDFKLGVVNYCVTRDGHELSTKTGQSEQEVLGNREYQCRRAPPCEGLAKYTVEISTLILLIIL